MEQMISNFFTGLGALILLGFIALPTIVIFNMIFDRNKSLRKSDNQEILKLLAAFLNKYPDQRFNQALVNLDIVKQVEAKVGDSKESEILWEDGYYEEPKDTLQRVKKSFDKFYRM